MGLDATVMCNCFREGTTAEPPFPRERLYLDEESYLHVRTEGPAGSYDRRLYLWMQAACPHPGLNYARERISNGGDRETVSGPVPSAAYRTGPDNFDTFSLRELIKHVS